MAKFLLSQAAKADLISVARYTEQQWGIAQRDIYLEKIFECFDQLCHTPLLGRSRDELYEGMRSIPAEKHTIYYYYSDNIIKIAAILHECMEPTRHLDSHTFTK